MKRRITEEQLMELTDEQKQRLREWWKIGKGDIFHSTHFSGLYDYHIAIDVYNYTILDWITGVELDKDTCLPLLDIGQMIDLLTQREGFPNLYISNYPGVKTWELTYICNPNIEAEIETTELCDALWESVKQVL
jgi:hypothetical protein